MSWEEDYLLQKVQELEDRLARVEASCPGMTSSRSTDKPQTSTEGSRTNLLPPAPTTASHSEKVPGENSTATSTGGPGPEMPRVRDSREDWVRYVVDGLGWPEDNVQGLSKNDIIKAVRSR